MLPLIWSPEAESDLLSLVEYVAERNAPAALALRNALVRAVAKLPQRPYLYRVGKMPDTRELIVRHNYMVIYRVEAAAIRIISVLHARQQYP